MKASVARRAVNTSNSGSGGLGFKPRPSRCFLRQGTSLHFVSLHPVVIKWVCDGLESHPGGSSNTPPCWGNRDRSGRLGLWLVVCAFVLLILKQPEWLASKGQRLEGRKEKGRGLGREGKRLPLLRSFSFRTFPPPSLPLFCACLAGFEMQWDGSGIAELMVV